MHFHRPMRGDVEGRKARRFDLALPRLGLYSAPVSVFVLYSQIQISQVRRMQELLSSYYPILIFMGLSALITLALILCHACGTLIPDPEKMPYECGFEAFDDARMKFDVKFYLVAICSLFLIWKLLSVSLGRRFRRCRPVRVLVNDVFPCRAYCWVRL